MSWNLYRLMPLSAMKLSSGVSVFICVGRTATFISVFYFFIVYFESFFFLYHRFSFRCSNKYSTHRGKNKVSTFYILKFNPQVLVSFEFLVMLRE